MYGKICGGFCFCEVFMENTKRVKLACYFVNVSMAIVCNLSPVLFLTFNSLYNISFTLLGTLVFVGFFTQLIVDIIFSLFSHKFNIPLVVKLIPVLTISGLVLYALSPFIFPNNTYVGILIGTFIFAASSGCAEVLISPVIAAIPSENPEREMSKLHSIYAWGVVGVIIISTLFLTAFDKTYWWILPLIFCLAPLFSLIMFLTSSLPHLETPEKASGAIGYFKNKWLWFCFLAIFLGGAAECTMAQWSSGFLESALGIPKIWGDIFGVALFAVFLGLGRTLYSKFGKNIGKVLFFGAILASACYFVAIFSPLPIFGLIACALTGFAVSMMWPGCLIVATDKIPNANVLVFAMMAAGGDLGASLSPQLVGIIKDQIQSSEVGTKMAEFFNLPIGEFSLRFGMLVGLLLCIVSIFVYLTIMLSYKKKKNG